MKRLHEYTNFFHHPSVFTIFYFSNRAGKDVSSHPRPPCCWVYFVSKKDFSTVSLFLLLSNDSEFGGLKEVYDGVYLLAGFNL